MPEFCSTNAMYFWLEPNTSAEEPTTSPHLQQHEWDRTREDSREVSTDLVYHCQIPFDSHTHPRHLAETLGTFPHNMPLCVCTLHKWSHNTRKALYSTLPINLHEVPGVVWIVGILCKRHIQSCCVLALYMYTYIFLTSSLSGSPKRDNSL